MFDTFTKKCTRNYTAAYTNTLVWTLCILCTCTTYLDIKKPFWDFDKKEENRHVLKSEILRSRPQTIISYVTWLLHIFFLKRHSTPDTLNTSDKTSIGSKQDCISQNCMCHMHKIYQQRSLDMTKPAFGVSHKTRLKPISSAT